MGLQAHPGRDIFVTSWSGVICKFRASVTSSRGNPPACSYNINVRRHQDTTRRQLAEAKKALRWLNQQEQHLNEAVQENNQATTDLAALTKALPGMNLCAQYLDPLSPHHQPDRVQQLRAIYPDPSISDMERYRRFLTQALENSAADSLQQATVALQKVQQCRNKVIAEIAALTGRLVACSAEVV